MQDHNASGLSKFTRWLFIADLPRTSNAATLFVWFWRFFAALCIAIMAAQLIWFHTVGIGLGFGLLLLLMTSIFRFLLKHVLRVVR